MVIEDIMDLFQFVDSELMLDALPIYVVKDIDKLPTTRSIDGESHQLIISKLQISLENENAELRNTVTSVCNMITDKMSCLSGLFSE